MAAVGSEPRPGPSTNQLRRSKEKRPFESWQQIGAIAERLSPVYGPMDLFAAATGLRRSELFVLEQRDIDRDLGVVYVRRAYANGGSSTPRPDGAPVLCHYRRSRLRRSTGFHDPRTRSSSRTREGVTSASPGPTKRGVPNDEYLEMHQAEPVTLAKLRWLLGKATAAFGEVRLADLSPRDVCAWRLTIPERAPL
jgi:hypothetical protein